MPSLAKLIDQVNKATYFSRAADEVLDALDRAGRRLYFAAVNERRMSFLMFDATSLVLTGGKTIYTLPAPFGVLKQLAEQPAGLPVWKLIRPLDVNDPGFLSRERAGEMGSSYGWGTAGYSQYAYAGPYLDGAAAQKGTQQYNIEIAPMPPAGLANPVRMIYEAKWSSITSANSPLIVPDEGTAAMESYAIAHLLRRMGDANAAQFEAEGDKEQMWFLTWMRERQIQDKPPRLSPYLDDLD